MLAQHGEQGFLDGAADEVVLPLVHGRLDEALAFADLDELREHLRGEVGHSKLARRWRIKMRPRVSIT